MPIKNKFSGGAPAGPGRRPAKPVPGEPRHPPDASERQELMAVGQALSDLPRATRKVFELYLHAGLSRDSIAHRLALSGGQVDAMLGEAMQALQRCAQRLLDA